MTLSWSFSDDRCSIRKTPNAITPITPGSPTNHLPDMVAWPCCQTIPKVTLNWFYTHPTGEEKHSCDRDPEPNLPCLKRRGAIFSPSNTPGVLDDPIPLSCRRQEDEERVESLDHFEDFDTAKNCPPGVEKLDQNMELYTAPTVYLSSHGNPRNYLGSFHGQNTKPPYCAEAWWWMIQCEVEIPYFPMFCCLWLELLSLGWSEKTLWWGNPIKGNGQAH